MVKLKVQVKAELENLDSFEPVEALDVFTPHFKVKCGSCREEHPSWDDLEMQGSRGTANFVWKCNFCKRAASASIDKSIKRDALTAEDSDSHGWATVVVVECRGCEFVAFDPSATKWKAKGRESGTVFDNIELEDAMWTDYDEKAGEPVSVNDVETRINRA